MGSVMMEGYNVVHIDRTATDDFIGPPGIGLRPCKKCGIYFKPSEYEIARKQAFGFKYPNGSPLTPANVCVCNVCVMAIIIDWPMGCFTY